MKEDFQSYLDLDNDCLVTSKMQEAYVNGYCQEITLNEQEKKEVKEAYKLATSKRYRLWYKVKNLFKRKQK